MATRKVPRKRELRRNFFNVRPEDRGEAERPSEDSGDAGTH